MLSGKCSWKDCADYCSRIEGVTVDIQRTITSVQGFVLVVSLQQQSVCAMSTQAKCKIAVPLYLRPGYGSLPCAWERLLASPDKNPIVVVNPDSGPGSQPFDLFRNAVNKCQAAGIEVIGYVRTEYSKRPLKDVLTDLQTYKTWYNVDGYFIDEMYHWGEVTEALHL